MKALLVLFGCIVGAVSNAQTAARIPVRQIAPADAKTSFPIHSFDALVQFGNGSVLIHDVGGGRLLLFDRSLQSHRVLADTASQGAFPYPGRSPKLFPYIGDTAAFTDPGAGTFALIGSDGKVLRAMAPVRTQDLLNLSTAQYGYPAFDPRGRFVYRGSAAPIRDVRDPNRTLDTVSVVRANFDTRTIDTIATVTLPPVEPREVYRNEQGEAVRDVVINPIPPVPDQWAVLNDGSVAVVRMIDYHIDWRYADGTTRSTPKMPFDWRRLTDADKLARIDSLKRLIDSLNTTDHPYMAQGTISCSPGPRGEARAVFEARCRDEREAGTRRNRPVKPIISFLPLDQIPDYVPAVRPFSVKPDRDNHLWILPSTTLSATGGGLLYDVVNRDGQIVERVQLPAGRNIAGFGPGGVVYLIVGDRTKGFAVERTRVIH